MTEAPTDVAGNVALTVVAANVVTEVCWEVEAGVADKVVAVDYSEAVADVVAVDYWEAVAGVADNVVANVADSAEVVNFKTGLVDLRLHSWVL